MNSTQDIFAHESGAAWLKKPIPFVLMILSLAAIGSLVGQRGMVTGFAFMFLPFIAVYFYFIFKEPKIGIYGLFFCNYFILGFARYIKGLPLGMSVDFHLLIIIVALFFKSFFHEIPWKNAKNELFYIVLVWFAWIVFQIINPEAISRVAWFYSMRSIGLYMLLVVPLIFIVFNSVNDLKHFFHIWAVFAIIGAVKGIIQKHIGLDPFEHAWLMGPAKDTHLLFGKLRVFSFFTDAGQFGASMGYSGVVFLILALNQKYSKKLKIFYAIVGVLSIYGLMISGTRGSIAVPVMGFALYIALQRNIKIIVLGVILGASVFVFFKYTTIGQSNYTIARMRTAFNPEDKSLQVRLENQRKLKVYMASRPIGAGIGATGRQAAMAAPNSMASQVPTDSWYVIVWVEQGIVGLTLHLLMLFYIVLRSSYVIAFKLKNPWIKAQMAALVSGMFGIMVASYGNAVLGQMPTVIIFYSSMAFLFLAQKYDEEMPGEQQSKIQLATNER